MKKIKKYWFEIVLICGRRGAGIGKTYSQEYSINTRKKELLKQILLTTELLSFP